MAQQQQAPKRPIPACPPYRDDETDPTTDFRDWLLRFEIYLEMVEGQDQLQDVEKIRYFIASLGRQALRTFSKDPIFGRRNEAGMTYADFLEAAKRHFSPPATRCKAIFDFHGRMQEMDESVDEYLTALRTMVLDCQFDTEARINDELLNKLVGGTSDVKTQQELLATPALTLERAMAIMRANEAAQIASTAIRSKTGNEIRAITTRGRATSRFRGRGRFQRGRGQGIGQRQQTAATTTPVTNINSCMGCGSTNHRSGDQRCAAIFQNCRFCGKQGHFERVCIAKKRGATRGRGSGSTRRGMQGSGAVRVMDAEVHQVNNQGPEKDTQRKVMATFYFADGHQRWIPIQLEVDTGAEPSIIPYTWYKQNLAAFPLKRSTLRLKNYDGTYMVGVKGTVTTKVQFGGRSQKLKIHVRDGPHQPIAGRNIIYALNINISAGPKGAEVQTIQTTGNILKDFPQLLSEKLGTYPGQPHTIRIRQDAIPRAAQLRTIPLSRQEAVNKEIRNMDETGIWEEVATSEWAHPMVAVPKPDGGERITTNLVWLNQFVIPERYPLPRIKDLFLRLSGAKLFTKLDLKRGYYHIPLTEESKSLTTTITPLGLRRYNRLPMGLTDAASAFQRRIHQALQGLPGVMVYIDDIIIYGKNKEEHDRNFRAVLSRLVENDFRIQPKKCIFSATEIPAFGHIITTEGIEPDPKNVDPIIRATPPTTVTEIQSFLGLVNYYNDFVPNLADIAEPLRALTRKNATYEWTDECQKSFQQLQQAISKAARLTLFDPNARTIVTTDASNVGLGAVLTQIQDRKELPIAFYNRTLDQTERNYAANEKEALAVMKACEHWENLLLGRPFTIRTDHQALVNLLTSPKNQRQSAKFQRWQSRLSEFNYKIEHMPGATNRVADYLSRLKARDDAPVFGIRLQCLQDATSEDEVLQTVKTYLEKYWPKTSTMTSDMATYSKVKNDLKWKDGLLWKAGKIVVPRSQRQQVLSEIHQGHPGVERMKRLLRQMYWWPYSDNMIRTTVDRCHGCQSSEKTKTTKAVPPTQIPMPQQPGEQFGMDITGPFDGRFLVAYIDYYSKYPELLDTKDTSSRTLIRWLKENFTRTGNPTAIVTDNGPQFTSKEFEDFLASRDIHHYRTSVYNPQENGLVEAFNRYLKYGIQAFKAGGVPWSQGLEDLLVSYRAIPTERGQSPADTFFGRPVRFQMMPNIQQPMRRTAKEQLDDREFLVRRKEGERVAGNRKMPYTGPSIFKKGDWVLTKLPHVPKGHPPYSAPKQVVKVLGFWTYLLTDGQVWHTRRIKAYRARGVVHEDEAAGFEQNQGIPVTPRRARRRPRRNEAERLRDGLSAYFTPQRFQ